MSDEIEENGNVVPLRPGDVLANALSKGRERRKEQTVNKPAVSAAQPAAQPAGESLKARYARIVREQAECVAIRAAETRRHAQRRWPDQPKASRVVHDFVHSNDQKFSGDTKKRRIRKALRTYYGKPNESTYESADDDPEWTR
jgi:hypothetical protein